MSDVELDYPYLMDNALRRVVKDVLVITQELGAAPGEHHFYIEFFTQAQGVEIPNSLLETYPERMTIVLQHQFKDLDVGDDAFAVTLWFKGEPARLTVPYDAVAAFADPGAQFELRFAAHPTAGDGDDDEEGGDGAETDAKAEDDDAPPPASPTPTTDASESDAEGEEEDAPKSADVVSLDAFRKK